MIFTVKKLGLSLNWMVPNIMKKRVRNTTIFEQNICKVWGFRFCGFPIPIFNIISEVFVRLFSVHWKMLFNSVPASTSQSALRPTAPLKGSL